MPVFTKALGSLDKLSEEAALKTLANHVRVLQEELEYRLTFLDSSNISEIDAGQTNILTEDGELNLVLKGMDDGYAQLRFGLEGLSSTVSDNAGNVSQLQQKADSIQSMVQNQAGDISKLEQTAASITSTVQGLDGDISQLEQTVDSIRSTVQSQAGQISQITQRADSIEASVGDLETGLGNTVRLASDGVTVTNSAGSRLTIDGGQINAETLNLTGRISFGDLDGGTQDSINNAVNWGITGYNRGSDALDGLTLMANGQYTGGTFIDGKNIYSPNLYGDTITLLDGSSRQVGTMSLLYSSTYAFDLTSAVGLRLRSGENCNTFLGCSGRFVQLDAEGVRLYHSGGLRIPDGSHGGYRPSTASYGTVFFQYVS